MISQPAAVSRTFMPGSTTAGHYQIELRCDVCHTPGMGVRQESCLECHAEELKIAKDTHPARKFNDPSNAELLEVLDARYCTTCHEEHVPDRTHPMGLSLPTDYCFRCHDDIAEVRPSHAGMAFNTCATAGCHNFHDNRALYENFLASHYEEDDFFEPAAVPLRNTLATVPEKFTGRALMLTDQDAPDSVSFEEDLLSNWASSTHAQAGVNCTACHQQENETWSNSVATQQCKTCHEQETEGFLTGRHGMRLAVGLEPMRPEQARLPMHSGAAHRKLTCNSCHAAHDYSSTYAAVDACLTCHADKHSLAYKDSPHYELWQSELASEGAPGTGVSCATCHLPRVVVDSDDGLVRVMHNQNDNLRPNEKMVRSVCANCHGVQFTLDALADESLIDRNFPEAAAESVDSPQMAYEWLNRRKRKNTVTTQ